MIIRVVPFTLDFGVAQSGGASSTEIPLDTQAGNIIDDGWHGTYNADDDTNYQHRHFGFNNI